MNILKKLTGERHRGYRVPPMVPLQQPEPVPATEQLKRNLERAEETYRLREHVLLAEIADRQAELVDVRRAADAVMAGLMELATDEALDAMKVTEGVDALTGHVVRRAELEPFLTDEELADVMRSTSGVTGRLPHG